MLPAAGNVPHFLWAALAVLVPFAAFADTPTKARPDPTAQLEVAAERADAGEVLRLAARVTPEALSTCVASAARGRRLACIEASAFAPTSPAVVRALLIAAGARDRAVASAASFGLIRQLAADRLADADLTPGLVQEIRTSLTGLAGDQRLGPDVRTSALRCLGNFPAWRPDLVVHLADPDPRIRREIVGILLANESAPRQLGQVAASDTDVPTAALAAVALCESGRVPAAVDRRIRAWLRDPALGPATLGPLIACARARAPRPPFSEWLAAALRSHRDDVRTFAAVRGD